MKTYFLIGNPNTGKSTLFNALTGMNQKIANYPGVTVEKKEGFLLHGREKIKLIDLPGTYSLIPGSIDEEIAVTSLSTEDPSHGVICIADATNLQQNLFLTTQIIDAGLPVILIINMIDEAEKQNLTINRDLLSQELGIPIFFTSAQKKHGISTVKNFLTTDELKAPKPLLPRFGVAPRITSALNEIATLLSQEIGPSAQQAHALRILSRDDELADYKLPLRSRLIAKRTALQQQLSHEGVLWNGCDSNVRHQWIDGICRKTCAQPKTLHHRWQDKIDDVATHKWWGPTIFIAIMGILFQALFRWSEYPMAAIEAMLSWMSQNATAILPPGPIASLIADGAIPGVGAVFLFIPQIAFLFFMISLLEDTGYMSRAAFVMDRFMGKFGLPGKAFIPLISSFACAIPGIMATRTIESRRDRIVTMMIAPLMSCSARLPVYTLLIAACIPAITFGGFIGLQGLIMWGLYTLGIVSAITVAFILKRTLLSTPSLPSFIEFPPYRLPQLSLVLKKTYERVKLFIINAGTIIFALSIILWFLTTYPRGDGIESSFAGYLGKIIEPLIAPLGFDWKIGVGLIASFAAREVFVSTMAIIYKLGDAGTSDSLMQALKHDAAFTPMVAISLLVFYVLACQCMSTVAVVKRETNTWRWPIFMVGYMTSLAYIAAFVVYQGGRMFGW
ncbi:MAG: ferrous iron transport protein B [Deltaproteobacteria bacterium]|nr:ferrous iron transport protein B [Deltaproteobacteria bacterium]